MRRLRVGLLVEREWLSRWQRAVVDALVAGGDAEVVALIHASDPAAAPTSARASLWRLYNNVVVARRARAVRRAPSSVPASELTALGAVVERRGKWSQHFSDADLVEIRALDLDVILRFGLGIIRGGILDAARFGVWSFHHDDERVVRGGPPSFWEVYEGHATVGVVLQRLTERLDGGVPLARATLRTVLHSYPRTRDRTLLGAAGLPARVAREIRQGTLDPDALAPSTSDAPLRHNPTNAQMLRFLGRQARRAVTARLRGVVRADVWAVGVAPPGRLVGEHLTVEPVEWLPERERPGYFADPFPAHRDGRLAVLVEEFDEATDRGTISAFERTPDGWRLHPGVIDTGVHASYPFLVEDDGELYCIPETWQARRVECWRCVEYPTRWERAAVLLDDVPVVDPTVVAHGGRWWLFGTRKDAEPDAALHLWHAPALLGPWAAHPLNPVKIDVTSSRPAGTPFVGDGVLYRPAQDCSESYGAAVVCNRVSVLSEQDLAEEVVARVVVPPGRYDRGMHTYAVALGVAHVAVDGRRYGTNRHRAAREARARLRRLFPARRRATRQ